MDQIVRLTFGERVRPARGVWRLAKHIRNQLPNPTDPEKSISWGLRKSGARDAPHRDRDSRAPPNSMLSRVH